MRELNRLRMLTGVIVLFLGAVDCFGIPPCQVPRTAVKPDFQVTVILDKDVPVPNAKVVLGNQKGEEMRVVADSGGVAKFSRVPDGDYMVWADLPRGGGAKAIRIDSTAAQSESRIVLGYVQDVPPLHLHQQRLKLWGETASTAEDLGKRFFRPLANADVLIRNLKDDSEVKRTKTSEDGMFSVAGLNHGMYTVAVTSQASDYPWLFNLLMVINVDETSSDEKVDISVPAGRMGQCNEIAYQIGAPDLQVQLK